MLERSERQLLLINSTGVNKNSSDRDQPTQTTEGSLEEERKAVVVLPEKIT